MNEKNFCEGCKQEVEYSWNLSKCPVCGKELCKDCINWYAVTWVNGHRYYKCNKCSNGKASLESPLEPPQPEHAMSGDNLY